MIYMIIYYIYIISLSLSLRLAPVLPRRRLVRVLV